MSDKAPEPTPVVSPAGTAPAPAAEAAPVKPPRSKGYTNPALQAMGIPRLRIPSRNWLIFWGVVGSLSGMYFYDRYERQNKRQLWKDRVSQFAAAPMGALDLPRKVKVYIAPPPADYLDISMSHFRQYIKPILVAAAVDYEVMTENRQGEIRYMVAEEIRNKRRKSLGQPTSELDPENRKDALDRQIEQNLNRDQAGGVIIVGRGAYKEYMNGIQEGWLGPLEDPNPKEPEAVEKPLEPISDKPVESLSDALSEVNFDAAAESPLDSPLDTSPIDSETAKKEADHSEFPDREKDLADILGHEPEKKEGEDESEEKKKKAKKPPVPKPFITGMAANSGRNGGPKIWAEEIPSPTEFAVARPEDISDPISIISHRHVLGFLNFPIRIYRFYTRRYLADELGGATAAAIFAATRPFDAATDPDALLVEEKEDWANKWKQTSIDNGSEWMWDFGVDERIAEKMRVYDLDRETRARFEGTKSSE